MNKKQQWIVLLLASAIAFLTIIGWHNYSKAQSSPNSQLTLESAGLTLEKVGSGVYALISSTDYPPKSPNIAICNAGIIIGDNGVLVIDPFQNKALGSLLLSTVESLTDQPVRYVFNTHFHFDHTGGNPAAKAKGIPILGRGKIRQLMMTRNQELDPNLTPPELIVNSNSSIWLGERKVELEEIEGHSGGTDMIAYVPDAKVMFAGDILFHERIPFTGDGNIAQWQSSLSQLMTKYSEAIIVPGHGIVTNSSGLEKLNQYFTDLEKLAKIWKDQSLTQEQAIASASQVPEAYKNHKFQGLYQGNLETAYQQFVLNK